MPGLNRTAIYRQSEKETLGKSFITAYNKTQWKAMTLM